MTQSQRLWWMVLILLLAAGLRMVDLTGVPPGLEHDEVANWLIDQQILSGHHALYYTQAYGHEAGYHYLQAAAVALFGDHALGLRLPSAFAGLLGVAVAFTLGKRLFGDRVALVSAALLGILFWSLFFARLGVRAILLPAVSGLAAYFFWRGLTDASHSTRHWALAGVLAGASMYSYMAARAVPLIFLAWLAYLWLAKRRWLHTHWRGVLLFLALFVVVVAPLAIWLTTNPGAEFRISEIDQPLKAMKAGDFRPVLENGIRLLLSFGWQGDPLLRQNLPGRPVFDPVGALLFYVGLVVVLWRWRRPEMGMVLIWLALSLTPSLVTADAPSSIRCINALPVLGIFPALAVEQLLDKLRSRRLAVGLVALWLLLSALWTARDYFYVWPQEPEVEFVWQTGFQEAAAILDAELRTEPVVVGGWTPTSMDPSSMELMLRREDLAVRYVDPTQALILPAGGGRMVWPAVLPLAAELEDFLAEQNALLWVDGRTSWVDLPAFTASERNFISQQVAFNGKVNLLGYQYLSPAAGASLLTFWEALGPVDEPLAIFIHLLDADGRIVDQYDGLGAPAEHWQAGDTVVVLHNFSAPAGEYTACLGLYNAVTGQRYEYSSSLGMADTLDLNTVVIP